MTILFLLFLQTLVFPSTGPFWVKLDDLPRAVSLRAYMVPDCDTEYTVESSGSKRDKGNYWAEFQIPSDAPKCGQWEVTELLYQTTDYEEEQYREVHIKLEVR